MSQTPSTFPFGQPVVWEPNPQWISESNLQRFMDRHGIADYDTLLARSTDDIAWFWDAVLEDLNIEFFEPYTQILDDSEGPAFPQWCVGGKLNIVHNCLDKWQGTAVQNRVAVRWEGEEGHTRLLTYRDLYRKTNRCANALKSLGLGKGDVIALYMPMTPELIAAFLAIAKIGGIILPLFSGYGPEAIATRLNAGKAKAVFAANGFLRRGRPVAMKPVLNSALENVPSVEHVIVVQRTFIMDEGEWDEERDHRWESLVGQQPTTAETVITDAEDPVMLIYTSGTTGQPKGAVHTHCGFPIKAAQDLFHPMDLKPQDTLYWMSDMGWMMGPWQVFGTLLIGASMVIYDGAPDYPQANRIWQLVENHGITHLGVSPPLIRAIKGNAMAFPEHQDLSSLRAIGSTGSPWDPESWIWLFANILEGAKPILNYSGGTEISGGIVCGNFFKPLKPAAFSGPVPGMAADVVNDAGESVRGEIGELVIRKPWIGMTRGFWQDRERYLDTYWRRFEGCWVHGDFAAVDDEGCWYMLGRSDDTIKVAGKRLGPAEVEAILNAHPLVQESAAIGAPHDVKGEEVVAFCVLQNRSHESDIVRKELMKWVTEALGKPLKPREIHFTSALPKTRNAKVLRRLIRATYLDQDPGDISSLEDPAAVDAIRDAR